MTSIAAKIASATSATADSFVNRKAVAFKGPFGSIVVHIDGTTEEGKEFKTPYSADNLPRCHELSAQWIYRRNRLMALPVVGLIKEVHYFLREKAEEEGFWVSAAGGTANIIAGLITEHSGETFSDVLWLLNETACDVWDDYGYGRSFDWYSEMPTKMPYSQETLMDNHNGDFGVDIKAELEKFLSTKKKA